MWRELYNSAFGSVCSVERIVCICGWLLFFANQKRNSDLGEWLKKLHIQKSKTKESLENQYLNIIILLIIYGIEKLTILDIKNAFHTNV